MELVKAIPITRYCDENSLSTTARLGLFVQVCQAVQHAHQKGIIHRDIKPSNILVADHDGVPVPKIIDFGIAKATSDQRLTDRTVFTALEQFIGTPAYMSPEQAKLSGLDIDTRSDIYSLGVLLYELLTGKTPFEAKRLLEAGLDEVRRIIREEEPVPPSTRLQTLEAAEQTTVAQHRQTVPPKLVHLIRGDLDWIVMKALEKDRGRRYETANGLAMDIQRHLENEPVVARPPSNLYRFQKLVRRNKLAFAAGTAVAAALLFGLAMSTFLYIQERRAHDSAARAEKLAAGRLIESENARKEAEAISKFLTEVFQSPDPARNGRTITVAETLSNAVTKLETDLASQPARRAKLQSTVGRTYHALGLDREAIPLQEKARDYYLATGGPEQAETLAAMQNLASSYATADRREEALKLREQVLALRRKVSGPEDPETIGAMNNLAISYGDAGRSDEALKLREEALALYGKVLGPEDPHTLGAMNNLAVSYEVASRQGEALKLREQVLALRRKVSRPEDPDTLRAMMNLAASYDEAGRRGEALQLREEELALSRKVLGPRHPGTIGAMRDLATSYSGAGRREEALALREQVLALYREVLRPESSDTLGAMNNLAISYEEAGRREEALKLREQVLALRPKVSGPEHPDTLMAMYNLAISYDATGRREEAIKLSEQTLALRRKVLRPDHPDTLWTMNNLASYYDQAGRREEALKLREDVLAIRRKVSGPEDPATLAAMENLADSYFEAGRSKEAIALLQKACELDAKNADSALTLAQWQTWAGQEADYQATCRRLLQQAEATNQTITAERAALAYCLRPSTDAALLTKVLDLTQRALEPGKSNSPLPWYQLCLGLAQYRSGQYAAAERTLAAAEPALSGHDELEGTTRLFRAMSLFRQDRPEEARRLFSQAAAQMPPMPKDESKPLVEGSPFPRDLLFWWMAYKEAKALIESPSAPAAEPSAPK
jgi:tetratricopeptide (TPR) repeat protein